MRCRAAVVLPWLCVAPLAAQISGRIVAQGGVPLPAPANVVIGCQMAGSWKGYTDHEGYFTSVLRAGERREVSSIQSTEGVDQCQVEASFAGYKTQVVELTNYRDPVLITLRPLRPDQGSQVSFTSWKAPQAARTLFEEGEAFSKGEQWPQAAAKFKGAVAISPDYAAAWNELGHALEQQTDRVAARDAYLHAIASDGQFLPPRARLAALAAKGGEWNEVERVTAAALKLAPVEIPDFYFYNAVANYNLGRLEPAENSAHRAIQLDRNHRLARAEYVLGSILAKHGDLSGAVEHMGAYLKLLPEAADGDKVRGEIRELESRSQTARP